MKRRSSSRPRQLGRPGRRPRCRRHVALPGIAREEEPQAPWRGCSRSGLSAALGGSSSRRYAGERDVVFGTVVAGRPPELPGVETMIGSSSTPSRCAWTPDPGAARHLPAGSQENQAEMRQDEHAPYAPLAEIQRWSAVPPGEPLFSSLFVFENYPVRDSLGEGRSAPCTRRAARRPRRHPLSLAVAPVDAGRRLGLRFTYDGRLAAATVDRLARHLTALLDGFVSRDGGEAAARRSSPAHRRRAPSAARRVGRADLPPACRSPMSAACTSSSRRRRRAPRRPWPSCRADERSATASSTAPRHPGARLAPWEWGRSAGALLAERSPETVVGLLAILKAEAPTCRSTQALRPTAGAAARQDPQCGSATRLPLLLNGATAAALPEAAREGFVPVLPTTS